jgi:hypothetical protein
LKKYLLTIILGFIVFISNAQVQWFANGANNTAVYNVQVCTDTTFLISIKNNTGATLQNCQLSISMPNNLSYILGSSIETTTGSPIKNLTEDTSSTAENGLLKFDSIPVGQWITFKYRVRTGCGSPSNAEVVIIQLTHNLGGSSPNTGGLLPTIDIVSASLDAFNSSALSYTGTIGNVFNQCDSFRNIGAGYLDLAILTTKAFIKLDFTGKGISLNSGFSINGFPASGSLIGDTLFLNSSDITHIGNGNTKWENNEILYLCYNVKINSCNNLGRSIRPIFGCHNNFCQIGSNIVTNVNISSSVPNLVFTPKVGRRCYDGTLVNDTIIITNNGSGGATNILFDFKYYYPGQGISIIGWDTSSFKVLQGGVFTKIGQSGFTNYTNYWGTNCLSVNNTGQLLNLQNCSYKYLYS